MRAETARAVFLQKEAFRKLPVKTPIFVFFMLTTVMPRI
jgi:hypothetical protein